MQYTISNVQYMIDLTGILLICWTAAIVQPIAVFSFLNNIFLAITMIITLLLICVNNNSYKNFC